MTAASRLPLTIVNGAMRQLPAGDVISFTLNPIFSVIDYGAVDDLRTNVDAAITSGTATLACINSNPFRATDVGKTITVQGAGAAGVVLRTTILTFTDAAHVTLNTNALTTVSGSGFTVATDSTTAIQNAITAATAKGGIVWFPITDTGNYATTATLNLAGGGVQLWGGGGVPVMTSSNAGQVWDKYGGTWLHWWGTTSDIVLSATSLVSGTAVALTGFVIENLAINCRNNDQNQALVGLRLRSAHGAIIRNFLVSNPKCVGIDMQVVTTLGDLRDVANCLFNRVQVRCVDDNAVAAPMTTPILCTSAVTLSSAPQSLTVAANTLPTSGQAWIATNLGYPVLLTYTGGGGTVTLTGCTVADMDLNNAPATINGGNIVQCTPSNACCLRMGGASASGGAGIINNTFDTLILHHGNTWGPAAWEFEAARGNDCRSVYVVGGDNTNDGAINRRRKPGVRFNGSNTNALLVAKNNSFHASSAGVGGCSVMGVNNAAARLTTMAEANYWRGYRLDANETIPVVEGNAYFQWWPIGGFATLEHQAPVAVATQAIANALTLITGTLLAVPPQGWQIGTTFRWRLTGVQTAAAASVGVVTVRIGTAGTTADAAVMTATFPAATVAAGTAFQIDIELTVGTLGAAATVLGKVTLLQGTAAGIGGALSVSIPVATFATFSTTTAQEFVHVDFISGAAGTTLTFQTAVAQVVNASNP